MARYVLCMSTFRALHVRADILRQSRDDLLAQKIRPGLPASVKLLVDREIAAIELAMFAVENQIIELGRVPRQDPDVR
jgi:hypothetical protein